MSAGVVPVALSIHHVAMRTLDPARLEHFYVDVIGLSVVRRDVARASVWLGVGSAVLMIEMALPGEPRLGAGSLELVAFAVEETAPYRMRLARAGVAIEAETAYTLYFRDPDGRRVGLSTFPVLPFVSPA